MLLDFLHEREGGLLGYALATREIEQEDERFRGRDLVGEEPLVMQRLRPDGHVLTVSQGDEKVNVEPWRYTKGNYPTGLTLSQLFEKHVEAHPEKRAVLFKDTRLNYAELNRKANQLARYLVKVGVGPEKTVVVSMDRSYEVYIALLAIHKAGGVYVPLEPLDPEKRLAFFVRDSNPLLILTKIALASTFQGCGKTIFCLDTDWDKVRDENESNLSLSIDENTLSDILYTSGSTGLPKGVLSTHKNRINALFAWQEIYHLSSDDILFQTISLSFDVFTADYTRSLCLGATLVPSEENFTKSANASVERMYQQIKTENVTFAELSVTTMRKLFRYVKESDQPLDFLRIIVVGSDAWYVREDTELSNYCHGKTTIFNAYGLTEEAVDSVYFERSMIANPNDPALRNKSLIGIPFPNTKVYLLGENLKPVQKGHIGTLYFGGPNTARGYLHNEELTRQRFIQNPFNPDEKIYDSGDLARVTEDNVLAFLGRSDFQVEIESKQVAVHEVEAAIHVHPSIKEVVVVGFQGEKKETTLVAYITFHTNKAVEIETLKTFLRGELPEYMLPSLMIVLETFPLNSNGEVDREMLPTPHI